MVDKFEDGQAMLEETVVTEIKSIDLEGVRAEEAAVRKANAEARAALKALAFSQGLKAGKRLRRYDPKAACASMNTKNII